MELFTCFSSLGLLSIIIFQLDQCALGLISFMYSVVSSSSKRKEKNSLYFENATQFGSFTYVFRISDVIGVYTIFIKNIMTGVLFQIWTRISVMELLLLFFCNTFFLLLLNE